MARPLRIQYDGAVYHVTSRGNERKPIFKDKADREIFLNLLRRVNEKYHWVCHTYCLMDNHYHLVIETPQGNLSGGMRQLNGVYTQRYNRRYSRVGHLFQGRFNAILVQKESYLLEVCRYVVLNPIRASLVKDPSAWKWSSYTGTGGLSRPNDCLTIEWMLSQFGSSKGDAQRRYRQFIKEGMEKDSIWKELKGQSLLGDETFIRRLGPQMKEHQSIKEIPKRQRHLNQPSLHALFPEKIKKDKSRRNQTIQEAVMTHGYTQRRVADYLGMHYATISRLTNERNTRYKT